MSDGTYIGVVTFACGHAVAASGLGRKALPDTNPDRRRCPDCERRDDDGVDRSTPLKRARPICVGDRVAQVPREEG